MICSEVREIAAAFFNMHNDQIHMHNSDLLVVLLNWIFAGGSAGCGCRILYFQYFGSYLIIFIQDITSI